MKIIFLGAPGAGKGTQAARVSAALGIPAVSTGEIIREAVRSGSPLGIKFKSYTDQGKLVPDELVVSLLEERLKKDDCSGGFILDGFPRNIEQAKYLDSANIVIDKVINIVVPDEGIVRRMSGRRFCPQCQSTYHTVHQKPKREGICDHCGAKLVLRDDDKPETVLNRLAVYHAQTEPLIAFYAEKLITVDGTASPEEISQKLIEALKK